MGGTRNVTVYQVRLTKDDTAFFASMAFLDVPEDEDVETRGWLGRQGRTLKTILEPGPDGRLTWAGRLWVRLRRWLYPDEVMLRALRRAETLVVVHPTVPEREAVEAAWSAYLSRRRIRHAAWLVVHAVLAPLSLALMILPGPNVIGYWFVFRAVCHVLVLTGIGRARALLAVTAFHPNPALDPVLVDAGGRIDVDAVARIAETLRLDGLDEFVRQVARPSDASS